MDDARLAGEMTLEGIARQLEGIKSDLTDLKADVSGLKGDVTAGFRRVDEELGATKIRDEIGRAHV